MRAIKFRAWSPSEKIMFDVERIEWSWKNGKTSVWRFIGDHADDESLELFEDAILLKFTGLRDKKGVEIFEGDIFVVRSLHDGDEGIWNQQRFNDGGEGAIPQVVTWDQQSCCFEFGYSTRIKYESYDFEIIGNIYENPELVKP